MVVELSPHTEETPSEENAAFGTGLASEEQFERMRMATSPPR